MDLTRSELTNIYTGLACQLALSMCCDLSKFLLLGRHITLGQKSTKNWLKSYVCFHGSESYHRVLKQIYSLQQKKKEFKLLPDIQKKCGVRLDSAEK